MVLHGAVPPRVTEIGGDGLSIAILILMVGFLSLSCVAAGSGAFFLFRRHQRKLEGEESAADVARLQESVDALTSQVHLLEEEKEFYRELGSPGDTPRKESESEKGPDSGGSH